MSHHSGFLKFQINLHVSKLISVYSFVKKVVGFTLILYLVIFLINCTIPYYWSNSLLTQKIEYLKSNPELYNTVAIGSSKVYRHFIPKEFDEIANTKSFNLGAPAMFMLEYYYLLDNLTEENTNIKNILFLASPPVPIAKMNLHSIRSKYFMDWKRSFFSMKFFKNDWDQMYKHALSFLENIFNIGEFSHIISYHFEDKESLSKYLVEEKGFFALDHEEHLYKDNGLKRRKANFVNVQGNRPLAGIDKRMPEVNWKLSYEEQTFLDELEQIQILCNKKGVNIQFIFLPNSYIQQKSDFLKTLYLGDGVEFPEYFSPEYIYDKGHLNNKGAILFTKRLAKLYSETNNLSAY